MNIEEAKELVDNSKFYGKTSSVIKAEVRDIIDQLNQPKPEVPQCVADWIEECKEEDLTLSLAYDVDAFGEVAKWLYDTNDSTNIDLFAQAWLAYPNITIEKEKLYTVEIPNPNDKQIALRLEKWVKGKVRIVATYSSNNFTDDMRLAEREIRKDFDWAWQFAKEVTE
ncbi:TPA: DUF1642 domain-containing protein [Streptococcus pyogenes]|uniref:DUF1642 domain-containing protein n=1 Tax=Streptococcus pyogenes phage T12 TaxID=35344 RepID=UPI00052A8977|nr:DUF1642 domain-containing protein [Streptococcus pyogenes]YP_009191700.1 DUF1642 domain-containing protein [Streptococcus phage T12]QBX28754.1 hypothetical protein Javan464_0039 [Streptococcus phage Javan464]AIU44373.1 hypothetical protein T12_31 [Streptococcus phage T12]MCF1202150.1 DUF1642 domain-containing protein [Streptococcus pyogenes]VGT88666.1 phage protein [Streptococcus pyogenes]VGU01255.1 phage protein [Streptococcus pyogenes]